MAVLNPILWAVCMRGKASIIYQLFDFSAAINHLQA